MAEKPSEKIKLKAFSCCFVFFSPNLKYVLVHIKRPVCTVGNTNSDGSKTAFENYADSSILPSVEITGNAARYSTYKSFMTVDICTYLVRTQINDVSNVY